MKRIVLLIAMGLFILMACASGGEHFEKANQFRAQKNMEMAIQFYEKALKEEPDNAEYRKALETTQRDFATIKYNDLVGQYNATSTFNVKVLAVNMVITQKGTKKAYIKLSPDNLASDIASRMGMI